MQFNLIESKRFHHLSLLLFISVGILQCSSQTIQDTQDVITAIMTGYNKNIRPAAEQSRPVSVNISFDLVAIREFVEVNEKLSVVGILNMEWVDLRLRWDPSRYNNTETVTLPMNDVWRPNLILGNSIDEVKAIGHTSTWMVIRYHYSGKAVWAPGDVYDASCPTDVTFFPFDIQKCKLKFIPWGHSATEVYITSKETVVGQTYFEENGEWILRNTQIADYDMGNAFALVTVYLDIERRPMFMLVNVVLPIIFMGFLNVLVFALPVQSGERVSYAITVLLAIAVFLTIVGDNMPKTSSPMSTISYFLLETLILSSCICLVTIINLNIFFQDEGIPVPKFIAWVTQKIACKRVPKMTQVQDISAPLDLSDTSMSAKESEVRQTWAEEVTVARGDDVELDPVTWQDVSRALDRVFGIMAFLLLVAASVGFLVVVASREVALSTSTIDKD